MHEQERKNLWSLRYQLMKSDPELLSKLLDCVDWNNRFEVSEAISILQRWPQLPPQKALELLDYAYADQAVRNYAVSCLRNLGYVSEIMLITANKSQPILYSDVNFYFAETIIYRCIYCSWCRR